MCEKIFFGLKPVSNFEQNYPAKENHYPLIENHHPLWKSFISRKWVSSNGELVLGNSTSTMTKISMIIFKLKNFKKLFKIIKNRGNYTLAVSKLDLRSAELDIFFNPIQSRFLIGLSDQVFYGLIRPNKKI
jgi:hypothetical protein